MIKIGNLTKNSIYYLLGNGLPFLIGIVTIPRLVHVLGNERFGILALNWAVLGYFSLFDLGLGRALTQIVAERTGADDLLELPDIIRTALVIMFLLGIVGTVLLAGAAPVLVSKGLTMTSALRGEVLASLLVTAVCIPAVTLLGGIRGILEGRQHFFSISALRLGMGILTFLGPWLVSFKTVNIFWVIASLLVMRYVALYFHFLLAKNKIPEMKMGGKFRAVYSKMLVKFGGWMTVSNVISPLMVNFDRFFIGVFLSISAVTYYATSFEVVTKILIVSGAIVSVLFPVFGSLHRSAPKEIKRLYNNGLKVIALIVGPILLIVAVGSPFFLSFWLGPEFSHQGSQVMRILCIGVLLNSLAAVPFAFVQGLGRPDLTAKCHIIEIPIYITLLWLLGTHFGIIGVAWAWTIRVTLDLILLVILTQHMQKRILMPSQAG